MVARSTRQIRKALLRKGFVEEQSHHIQFHFPHDGYVTDICTFLSHGSKDYGDALLAAMSRQLHLSKPELLQFIDCTMSGDDYLGLMRERGHLE